MTKENEEYAPFLLKKKSADIIILVTELHWKCQNLLLNIFLCSRSKQTIKKNYRTGKKWFMRRKKEKNIDQEWIGHVADKQDWHFQYGLAMVGWGGGGGYYNMKNGRPEKRRETKI